MNNINNLYDPAKIERLDDGQFWHPDLPESDGEDAESFAAALAEQGFVYSRVGDPEDYVEDDGGDEYWAWLRAWEPEAPEGDGWRLACIADTEDGPAAWFVRPKAGDE